MSLWETLLQQAREWRHHLHQFPELSWHEENTAAFIRARLDDIGVSWRTCATLGTLAQITPEHFNKHIAQRI